MKDRRKRRGHLWGTLLVVWFCLCSMGLPAAAQEQIRLIKGSAAGADAAKIQAELPFSSTYKVYRADRSPEAGGVFRLVDIFDAGSRWISLNGGMWQRRGTKGRMICFDADADMKGEVLFYDTGLSLGRTYYYKLVAEYGLDGEKAESNTIMLRTTLTAPDIRKAYTVGNTSVKLTWMQPAGAKGYEIYRQTGGAWKKVKTIKKAGTLTFTDRGLKSGKTYKYKVRAYARVNGKKQYSDFGSIYKVRTKKLTVKGSYRPGSVYGPSLNTGKLTEVRRVVQSFKDNYIRKGMSDYEKVAAAYTYLRNNCSYAWRGWQYNGANTAWGALVYGEAQCSGYARAMKALCDAVGVPCRYVHASSKASNPSHQWNMVRIDRKWYVLDAQGGYFLVGEKTWNKIGMYWNKGGLPKCSRKDHPRGGFLSSEM